MNKNEVYKQADECLLEDMDGEMLLYNPKNATTLHLNGPAAVVWQLCTGENPVQEIIDALQEAYPEQAADIEADVIMVIKDLKAKEAIELVTS